MWNEDKHPRDLLGRFCEAENAALHCSKDTKPQAKFPSTIKLPDEVLPHSVGAKWANHIIAMPDGTSARFAEGAVIEHKEIIAGYKVRRKIDDIQYLLTTFPETQTTPRLWSKVKGVSEIVLYSGEHIKAEIHWYEHPKTGKQKFKYKKRCAYED